MGKWDYNINARKGKSKTQIVSNHKQSCEVSAHELNIQFTPHQMKRFLILRRSISELSPSFNSFDHLILNYKFTFIRPI